MMACKAGTVLLLVVFPFGFIPAFHLNLVRQALTLSITVNGEPRTVDADLTVWDFIKSLSLDPKKVAVERNLEIVSKSLFRDVILEDGDQLEIVHFIGGG